MGTNEFGVETHHLKTCLFGIGVQPISLLLQVGTAFGENSEVVSKSQTSQDAQDLRTSLDALGSIIGCGLPHGPVDDDKEKKWGGGEGEYTLVSLQT